MADLKTAVSMAKKAHQGHMAKEGGPYIKHPLRVMKKVSGDRAKMVAVLHDTVEDTDLTLQDLKDAGFDDDVVDAVDRITKRKGESYTSYISRVKGNPLSRIVKLADISDNLDRPGIPGEDPEKSKRREEKYRKAIKKLR